MRTILRLTAIAVAASIAMTPAAAETWSRVVASDIFAPRPTPATVADEGVTVTLTPGPPDDESDAIIVVQFPGVAPYQVPTDEYRASIYGISVGIGRMAREDPAPTVLLGGYSGGAHCCATLQVVSLVDGRPTAMILPMTDGEPADAFPTDLDGDGERDIRRDDDSLLYAFTSYAGSTSVPRFYNLRRGELVDVSRKPGFAAIFRDFAEAALAECRKREVESAGPCAAYAYAMALQGKAEEGIRTAVTLSREPVWYPLDCTVEWVDDRCPEGKERTFAGFEDALRWMMRKHGYLP